MEVQLHALHLALASVSLSMFDTCFSLLEHVWLCCAVLCCAVLLHDVLCNMVISAALASCIMMHCAVLDMLCCAARHCAALHDTACQDQIVCCVKQVAANSNRNLANCSQTATLCAGVEDKYNTMLTYYGLGSLSMRNSLHEVLLQQPELQNKIWPPDDGHPTCLGTRYLVL